jgi:hypothetical protein
MKKTKITLLFIIAIAIAACSTSKKSAKSTAVAPASTTPTPASSTPLIFAKSAGGIYAPGNEELTAIKAKYSEVTLDKLKEGYTIYTEGACIGCHVPQSIYERDETQWKSIMDDMALRANITDSQKDAVYKYVLAIKAKQPK